MAVDEDHEAPFLGCWHKNAMISMSFQLWLSEYFYDSKHLNCNPEDKMKARNEDLKISKMK